MALYDPIELTVLMCSTCGKTIGYADPEGPIKKIGLMNFPSLFCSPRCKAKAV